MSHMKGEAMPVIDRSEFDQADMPQNYIESLSFAELLALARYIRHMAEALDTSSSKTAENAWLQSVHELGRVGIVADERQPATPLEALIREEIGSVTTYGNGDDDEAWPYPCPVFTANFFSGRLWEVVEPEETNAKHRQLLLDLLKDTGPCLWSDLHRHLLIACGQREEDTNFALLAFEMHRGGLIVISTATLTEWAGTWDSAVRLADEGRALSHENGPEEDLEA